MRVVGVLVAFVCLVASGCGGGGGGSGGGGGPSGSLALSTSTLTFTTNDPDQTPPSQTVTATLTTNASGTLYLRVESTGPAVAAITGITVTGATTGQGTVVPAPAATLGPGVHTSTVTVTACTTSPACTSGIIGSPQTIAVTYTINGVTASAQNLAYNVGLNATADDFTRALTITAHPGYTATTDVDWLSLSPSTGSGGAVQMNADLAQAIVDGFESGQHTATITVTAPSGDALQIPLTLTVEKPQLDQVMPYVAASNTEGVVTMRGQFLNLLPPGSLEVATTATGAAAAQLDVTTISPTELRVTHPPLPAGTYLVRMRDAQGEILDRSTARLVVVDPPDFAAGTLSYPVDSSGRMIRNLIYDAERKALLVPLIYFAGDKTVENVLLRYEYATDWSAATVLTYPRLENTVLAADGRTLITSSSPTAGGVSVMRTLTQHEPTTLAAGASLEQTGFGDTFYSWLGVLSTNDVLALESSKCCSGGGWRLARYSVKNNTVALMSSSSGLASFTRVGALSVSGNGMRAIASANGGSTSDRSVYEYDAATDGNVMTQAPVFFDGHVMRMDQTGDALYVRGTEFIAVDFARIYDRDWNVRGNLPLTFNDVVLTRKGTRAYMYGDDGKVHVYDLTTSPGSGGQFPEIGTGLTLVASPDSGARQTVVMALTPDERTLFLAGDAQVVILPLP